MNRRSLLVLAASVVTLSPAFAGFVSKDIGKSEPAATRQEPAKNSSSAQSTADKPEAGKPSRDGLGKEKTLLGRLVTELQRSPRSFLYLRSVGYTQSDQEFEELISRNNAIFQRTRIVRRDEQGNRQIPGWPGVTLTAEYKSQKR